MSTISKLKGWLTIEEAALNISNVIGAPVTLADIYQFSLGGELVLSVNFINRVKAKKITFIKKEDIKYHKVFPKNVPNISGDRYFEVPINALHPISKDLWVESIEKQVVSLSGVYDLSMIGTEKFNIKQLYLQEISSDIEVKVPTAMGVYVKGEGETYQLQLFLTMNQYREQHNNLTVNGLKPRILDSALAYPANRLDEFDYVLVVKEKEVTKLIRALGGGRQEVQLSTETPNTINNIKQTFNKAKTQAKYLAFQREATKLKKKHPNKPKTWIAVQIAKLPIADGNSAETIRRNIKI